MALTDWIQTAAVIYFAWQQNRIFERQNQIFAGSAAMPRTSQLPRIARYWPTLVMVGLVALTGYDIYARHGAPPIVPWWFYATLLLIVAVIGLVVGRLGALPEKPRKPSKLVIHWANYRAIEDGGDTYDVADFLRQIISGDSLVFNVENDNFVIGDKNFVPRDPLPFKKKRLEVHYSYAGEPAQTVWRHEHDRMLLPKDSLIQWLVGELDALKAAQAQPSQSLINGLPSPDPSWVRFLTTYPEITGPPAPGKEPAKKPQKVRCEFMNCTKWSYKVKVISWDPVTLLGFDADFWRGCLQLRIAGGWYPEWNGVEELHVAPTESFRLWAFPKATFSDEQFRARINAGNLGTVHLLINGKEIAVSVG